MKLLKTTLFFALLAFFSAAASAQNGPAPLVSGPVQEIKTQLAEKTTEYPKHPAKPVYVRGIHLTSWVAGSIKAREYTDSLLDETELNTVVIDIKEYKGEVYIHGVKTAEENKVFVQAIPDIKEYLAGLKKRKIFTSARIVCFKDDLMARKKPEWAVKSSSGGIWQDRAKNAWLDPYNKQTWHYIIEVAKQAVALGFEEIQFDYIRFPSDGNIKTCRYSQKHSSQASGKALHSFLEYAYAELKPLGVDISIDIFGLVTTNTHDMGIGQNLMGLSTNVDYLCPMVYPSHYNPGEYGLADPDLSPYETVYFSLNGAKRRLGEKFTQLRPYLQDFSIKSRYGEKQVREQIQAAYDNGIGEWLLWNPRCKYTRGALKSQEYEDVIEKSGRPAPKMNLPAAKPAAVSSGTVTTSDLSVEKSTSAPEAVGLPAENESREPQQIIQEPLVPQTTEYQNNTTPQIR